MCSSEIMSNEAQNASENHCKEDRVIVNLQIQKNNNGPIYFFTTKTLADSETVLPSNLSTDFHFLNNL